MNEEFITEPIIIHFELDNNEHQISIEQSITTEQSVKAIVHNIGSIIFWNNSNIKVSVSVLPAEIWSLKKKFSIWIIWSIVVSALAPDLINWVIAWLWDGRTLHEYVADWTKWVKDFFSTATTNFISEKNQDLFNKWIFYWDFSEAYEAKHKLYYSSFSNEKTKWIWFSDDLVWVIPRNEFFYRMNESIIDKDWIEPEEKFHNLIVVSQIVSEKDKNLARKVKDILDEEEERKSFDVYMKDEEFYLWFLKNPYAIKTIIVKMKYYLKRQEDWEIKVDKKEVVKVYKVDDRDISPLPPNAVITPAPRFPEQNLEKTRKDNQKQQSLFSE